MTWVTKENTFAEAVEVIEHFFTKPWSDGLPIIPPTEERISEMLAGTDLEAAQVLGEIPPLGGVLSVRDLAVHAVMAGCLPTYMPVLVAIVKAMLIPKFNLLGIQTTTHNCSPLAIVGGPVTNRIHMNSGHNIFGCGNRANATIGRAIRLVLLNVGGAVPEKGDKSTFGHPGYFVRSGAPNQGTACFGRPWLLPAVPSTVSRHQATGLP